MDIQITNYKYTWMYKIANYLPYKISNLLFKRYGKVTIYKNCFPSKMTLDYSDENVIRQSITMGYNNGK